MNSEAFSSSQTDKPELNHTKEGQPSLAKQQAAGERSGQSREGGGGKEKRPTSDDFFRALGFTEIGVYSFVLYSTMEQAFLDSVQGTLSPHGTQAQIHSV